MNSDGRGFVVALFQAAAVTASTSSDHVFVADSTECVYNEPTESTYRGGEPAWRRYLKQNFNCVGDVKAVSGPDSGGLRQEAIMVIANSGKWVPSMDGGRTVKTHQRQPIVFKFAD